MTSARERKDHGTCKECGHTFYDDWESHKHALGLHGYRSWTREDWLRKAEESGIPNKTRAILDSGR